MSKTIDERVVEMRFDNGQFERNVQTSMSTLDKLKQKLNLKGAAKGFDDISASAKRVDMSGLGKGIETVRMKFSALEVMGVTALANITNSAVEAGKKLVSAITIDPIKDGMAEYETQMNSIQTILANTQDEGTNVKIVNKALDELNTYADKTIYNFTEMTRNIGTFTAAGVKLDASVSAIKGIANLAAVSGSTSQQASTAMYQLSQALAAGKVQLMDWNSVVNAGMGGKVFQNALIRTSELLGTGAKAAIEANGSFRESLTKTGWLTTEVLTQTLDQFSTAAETQEEYDAAVKKFVDQGYTKEEAKQIADMARTAGEAATKVKTFSQLIDTLKEALGSGWTTTWRLIIGDFEEAKELWTGVSDVLGGFIQKTSDARNKLLESALGKSFTSLAEKLVSITEPAEKAIKAVDDLGDVVNKVINGDFGNGKDRIDALTEAGVNFYKVQNKVNETLGNSHRYTDKQISDQDKLLGSKGKLVESTKEETKETVKLTDEKKNLIKKMVSMSESEMRAKKYTEEQIAAMRELKETADKLGLPMDEFIDNLDQITGRWLLLNSFKNIGNSIINVFSAIGKAWKETFKPMSADKLFDIIAAFHKFTATIKNYTIENADKLTRTFKGLFAAIDIVRTVVGGGLSLAFKAISTILSAFDMDLLDLTAILGDAIVKFRDFLLDNDLVTKGFELMAKGVKMAVEALKDLYEYIKNLPKVQKVIENIKDVDLSEIGKNILEGLKNGLEDGVTSIPRMLIEIGKSLLEAIKGVLGIHSPSTEMYAVGQYTMEGLINGLKDGTSKVRNVITDIGSKILNWIKDFDWNKAFAVGVSVALLGIVKKLSDAIEGFTAPLKGLGSVLSGAGNVLNSVSNLIDNSVESINKVIKSFSKLLKAEAFRKRAEGIRNLAIAISILAGSVYLLAQLDYGKLWSAVGAITVLAGVLVLLGVAMDKLESASVSFGDGKVSLKGLKTGLLALGATLVLMAATVKIIGSMDPDKCTQGMAGLLGLIGMMILVFASFGTFIEGETAENMDKVGKTLKKLSVSLLLLAVAVKLIGTLSAEEMLQGAVFVSAFLVFVTALTSISLLAGEGIDKVGGLVMKISLAMALMVGVVKMVSILSVEDMLKGAAFASGFLVFLTALVAITKLAPKEKIAKLGGILLSVSLSMMLMVGVVKLASMLSVEEMLKGAAFAAGFLIFVAALINITKIGSEEKIAKVSGMVIAMSLAIGIMAGVCILLGLIDTEALAKGIVAVGMLGTILALMVKATKDAEDVKSSIIAMSVAIAVMAVAVAALSFIDPSKLAGAVVAMSILMGMFALMEKSVGTMNGAMRSLIVMTVAIGLMAGVLVGLSFLDTTSALETAASLGLLMLSLASAMTIISKTGSSAMAAMPAMLAMSGILAIVALILGVLSSFNVGPTLEIAASLSMLLLALSTSCAIMAGAAAIATVAAAGLAPMMVLMVGMGALMAVIAGLATLIPGLEEFLGKALPILNLIGQGIGEFLGGIIEGIGSAVLELLPKLGASLSAFMLQLQPFINIASSIDSSVLVGIGYLSAAILALTAANFISGIGQIMSFGQSFADLGIQLTAFAINALPFFIAIRTLDPTSVDSANTLAKLILTLSSAELLSGVSNLISKFTGGSGFDELGSKLTSFGGAVVAFSNTVKGKIDTESVNAAANAGKAMAELAKSLPRSDGFLQDVVGEKDLGKFGAMCAVFGRAIRAMSDALSGENGEVMINEAAIESAVKAGKGMTKIANAIPKSDGFLQDVVGEQDLGKFGITCEFFGRAIRAMSDSLLGQNGENMVNDSAIESAVKAGKGMTKIANAIPKSDGFLQGIVGEQDLADFGSTCKSFGNAIKTMVESLTNGDGNPIIQQSIVDTATTAGQAMIALQEAIPSDKWFDGKVQLDEFGKKIKKFGEGLVEYSEEVAGIDSGAVSTSISQANRILTLAKTVVDLDTDGISKFKKVSGIGNAMKAYSEKVRSIDTSAVSVSVSSALKLRSLVSSLVNLDTSGIENFKIDSVGLSMKSYSQSVSGLNSEAVLTSVTAAKKLVTLINSMSHINTSGADSFRKSIDVLARTNVNDLVKAFNGSTSKVSSIGSKLMMSLIKGFKSKQLTLTATGISAINAMLRAISTKSTAFINAGSTLGDRLASGLKSKASSITSSIASTLRSCILSINNYYNNFYDAGSYLVSGFASGISSNSYKAESKAKAMADAAYKAAKKTLDIHSPSKVFRRLGYNVPEGFAQGISRMGECVERSSASMAGTAISGTEDALQKMANIINNDVDAQPTISPVVDLSGVKRGVKALNGMMGGNSFVGLSADVGAISASMNRRRQNGGNDDVVSAINKLRNDVGNLSGPSYTVNGVTYDNGSEVSDAVKSLIRAIRIEGRA